MLSETGRIQDAAHRVLDSCLRSSAPLATLSEFTSKLRNKPNWTEDEVKQVEQTVNELLVGIYSHGKKS